MGKKIWYSTPLKFFWNELYGTQKKLTPELSDDEIFSILRQNIITEPLRDGETQEKRELMMTGLELWKEDRDGEFLHIFFLDKQLKNFLENTPLSDLDGIRQYLYQNGKKKKIEYINTKIKTDCITYSFGLHIPYENDGYAFLLNLYDNNSVELYYSRGIYHGRTSDKFYKNLNKKKDESRILCKVFRLAINTIAYMRCFPECVTEGVPKVTKSRDEERSEKNIMFQLTEEITDSGNEPRSKRPHFRKGHFKLLKSDYYTNKKGQLIYVSETMVKGKSKTVATSPQIDKFDELEKKRK